MEQLILSKEMKEDKELLERRLDEVRSEEERSKQR